MNFNHGFFQGNGGVRLFEQSWLPDNKPEAIVLLVHGLGEHSSRYTHVAEFLTAKNIGIETFDLRGHGRSDGHRAFVNSFDEYLRDMDIFLKRVQERHENVPVFLYGHSMGGTIVALYAITRKPDLNGLILSAAAIEAGEDISPVMIKMSSIVSKFLPKMKATKLKSGSVSRDPEVAKNYDEDPLNYREGIPVRTGAELFLAMDRIQMQMDSIILPILIMYGSGDKMVDPRCSRELYDGVNSEDKTLKMYNGFFHEIHNDPEKQQVFNDVIGWINSHK